MTELLAAHAAVLAGSILGTASVTLLPYLKKFRESEALGDGKLEFDKKFAITALIAFALATVTALMSFDENLAKVDTNATIIKVFCTAFGIAIGSNLVFNSVIKPSTTLLSVVREMKEENRLLKQQLRDTNKQ